MAHFYNKRFTDFLPEFTQISKQTFARINDIITTIYIRNRNTEYIFRAVSRATFSYQISHNYSICTVRCTGTWIFSWAVSRASSSISNPVTAPAPRIAQPGSIPDSFRYRTLSLTFALFRNLENTLYCTVNRNNNVLLTFYGLVNMKMKHVYTLSLSQM